MKKVAICIATYNRNDMLADCLSSIVRAAKRVYSYETYVIVVDNNTNRMAEEVVREYSNEYNVIYGWQKIPGIPFARNLCLELAKESGADFISFVDDDEIVDEDWLLNMVAAVDKVGVDVVSGSVIQEGSKKRVNFHEGVLRDRAETDNVIFKRWIAQELQFDEDFAQTGGSDTLFFRQAFERGAVIVCCDKAVVWETIPEHRSTLRWLLQRHYRYGMINCKIESKLEKGESVWLLIVKGIMLLPLGLLESILKFPLVGKKGMHDGLCRMMRGLGALSFFIGRSYYEYERK